MSTTSSIESLKSAPGTPRKTISAILSESLPPFDHGAQVVTPFEDETKRDAEFLESGYMRSLRRIYELTRHSHTLRWSSELNTMLLELIIEFHAWSAARPAYEGEKMADVLEQEVKMLRDAEKEQGTSAPSPSLSPSASVWVVGRRVPSCHICS